MVSQNQMKKNVKKIWEIKASQKLIRKRKHFISNENMSNQTLSFPGFFFHLSCQQKLSSQDFENDKNHDNLLAKRIFNLGLQ